MVAQHYLFYYIPDVKIGFAKNGKEAVDLFKKEKYDLILMDMQMPGYDGSKIIRSFKNDNNVTTKTPIIAMTASLLKSEIDSYYETGMNNYIPKPYSSEQLVGTIYEEIQKSETLINK